MKGYFFATTVKVKIRILQI